MTQLCSITGLVGPVSEGKWRISWTTRRYGRNLARSYEPNLKHQLNEWKHPGAPRPKKVRHTQCAVEVMSIVAYAPRCTSKADVKRCLLLHVPAAPPSSSAQEKTTILGGTEPHHSSWQCKESHRYCCQGRLAPLAMEILEHPPYWPDMSPCYYDLFTKVKEPLQGTRYNTRYQRIHAIGR